MGSVPLEHHHKKVQDVISARQISEVVKIIERKLKNDNSASYHFLSTYLPTL